MLYWTLGFMYRRGPNVFGNDPVFTVYESMKLSLPNFLANQNATDRLGNRHWRRAPQFAFQGVAFNLFGFYLLYMHAAASLNIARDLFGSSIDECAFRLEVSAVSHTAQNQQNNDHR